MSWKPPKDETLSCIDTTIECPNDNKIVIQHTKVATPKFADDYVEWKRKDVYVRNDGELVFYTCTQTYIPHKETWRETTNFTHTFDLADGNEIVAHDGREWKQYGKERSRKCVNLRFKNHREGKPDPISEKEAMKKVIEANY